MSLAGSSFAFPFVAFRQLPVCLGGLAVITACLLASSIAQAQTPGGLDASFFPGSGADGPILAVAVRSDGKILVGGSFTQINGATRGEIARLNPDGSLDAGFGSGIDFYGASGGSILAAAAQNSGKTFIGGNFTYVNSSSRSYLAALSATGGSASANLGSSVNNAVWALAVQPNGKIVLGGAFTALNGVARGYIARLNADGSPDSGFNPGSGANGSVYALALQADGQVVLGGAFALFNGIARNYVARLNGDAPAVLPTATTGAADPLAFGGAVLHASVNPQGTASTAYFQYGLDEAYERGHLTAAQNIGAGVANLEVSDSFNGLSTNQLCHYRVVIANANGTSYGEDKTFTTLSDVDNWRQTYFGSTANSGNAADTADPDGDGISNLMERALLGMNPLYSSVRQLPAVYVDPATGHLMINAYKGAPYSDGLVFNAEASSDLQNWSSANVTVLINDRDTFRARDDGSPGARRFLRLRVTQP